MAIQHNKDYCQRAFHSDIARYSDMNYNIGRIFVCVNRSLKDKLTLGIIGECIDVILSGKYMKFHFDPDNFYKSEYFRELRNNFGYTAEELREIEYIDGYRIVDIENNSFTEDFLNSPLSSSAIDRIFHNMVDKEPFVKNFNPKNSYHRLVNEIVNK